MDHQKLGGSLDANSSPSRQYQDKELKTQKHICTQDHVYFMQEMNESMCEKNKVGYSLDGVFI